MGDKINMKISDRIAFITEYGINYLTDWEQEFIDNIQIYISHGKELSWKQQKSLLKIYKRVEDRTG